MLAVRLAAVEQRLDALNRMLMDPEILGSPSKLTEVSKEHAQVSEVVDAWQGLKALDQGIASTKAMLDTESDPEIRELAKVELADLEARQAKATASLKALLLPRDPYDGRPIVLEIRAGTGGDEAALFAADLYRMYARFGERRGLHFEVLSSNPISVGGSSQGFKEIIAAVTGKSAYRLLRFESGVHRVQRIPLTEAQGRIHTSAATVAVMPEPDEVDVKVEAKDLRIDRFRSSGPGGQSVNTTDSAVRIVHIPTGITVQCQDEKSQLKNKEKAMRVLLARLHEMQQSERDAQQAASRKAQVGTGDRSERIRTYNFPQNRVTDHRIGLTLYKLDAIVNGNLDELADALSESYQASLLAEHGLE